MNYLKKTTSWCRRATKWFSNFSRALYRVISSSETRNFLISAVAVFVAMLSLGVSIWQGWESRQHYRLSIRPILDGAWDDKGDDEKNRDVWAWTMFNTGSGTAYIDRIRILCGQDAVIWDSLHPDAEMLPNGHICLSEHGINMIFVPTSAPIAAPAGTRYPLIHRVIAQHTWVQINRYTKVWYATGLKALSIVADYHDIYGTKFTMVKNEPPPKSAWDAIMGTLDSLNAK
ncbi:hypothetical protein COU79_00890 [Candidatus Peregrinibacteria bacterium CG10_big_fil_rev_8_21_14_0_10_54_7]|nr:MAG: hypothetical protein COU79_00890 [Candidatus Peregrinibacteria bacterium CG10_big_fil_rev_8_21_14_0_10_54_7]